MKATRPSSDGFRKKCLQCFRYLVTEYEFALLPRDAADKFSVSYQKDELVITVQGISWGLGVNLTIRQGDKLEVGFGHLLNLRDRESSCRPRAIEGQLNQVKAWAEALRKTAPDLLAGDLSVLPEVRDEQNRAHRQRQKEDRLQWQRLRREAAKNQARPNNEEKQKERKRKQKRSG